MVMVAIVLVGFLLRALPLQQNRGLEDEALYGYWGLQIASGSDPMLDREPVDKPPFFPYLLALSFFLFASVHTENAESGPAADGSPIVGAPLACADSSCRAEVRQLELASRLPSLFAGTVTIALLYSLGKRLYRSPRTGLLAAFLLALSPFSVLFGSTGFVDTVMAACVVAGLVAAVFGRPGVAGLFAGLAVATKQQGLLFLPLIALAGLMSFGPVSAHDLPPSRPVAQPRWCRSAWMAWLVFVLGFLAVVCATFVWDQARDLRPGFLEQSVISYGGLRLAPLSDIGDRAATWFRLVTSFWASPPLNVLFVVGLALAAHAAFLAARQDGQHLPSPVGRFRLGTAGRKESMSIAVALFLLVFLSVHLFVEVQLWDRYLLAMVPLAAFLLARSLVVAGRGLPAGRCRAVYFPSLIALVTACVSPPLVSAEKGHLAIGGDHGAYDGIDELAAFMRVQVPPGAVLYDHWLGHHHRFYLYGAPIHVHWYPDPADLARDAVAYRREPRYIAFPSWQEERLSTCALIDAGIGLVPVFEAHRRDTSVSFRLYQLVGP